MDMWNQRFSFEESPEGIEESVGLVTEKAF